jgi:hypothetical protein
MTIGPFGPHHLRENGQVCVHLSDRQKDLQDLAFLQRKARRQTQTAFAYIQADTGMLDILYLTTFHRDHFEGNGLIKNPTRLYSLFGFVGHISAAPGPSGLWSEFMPFS